MEKQHIANMLLATNLTVKRSKYLAEIISKLTSNEIEGMLSVLSQISWNRKLVE